MTFDYTLKPYWYSMIWFIFLAYPLYPQKHSPVDCPGADYLGLVCQVTTVTDVLNTIVKALFPMSVVSIWCTTSGTTIGLTDRKFLKRQLFMIWSWEFPENTKLAWDLTQKHNGWQHCNTMMMLLKALQTSDNTFRIPFTNLALDD